MHSSIHFISRFFRYILLGQRESLGTRDIIPVEEINIKRRGSKSQPITREEVKGQLILAINKLLLLICFVSFVAVIIYPFVYPEKVVPDTIQNAFFTTLGWFGGALGTFFQMEKG